MRVDFPGIYDQKVVLCVDGGLIRLRQAQQLAPSEKKIADVILFDPSAFLKMTLAELAQVSGSSQAAVVRLWRTLDFAGFHDLKLRVAGDVLKESATHQQPYEEIDQSSDLDAVMNAVQERSLRGIQDTRSLNDAAVVESAVEAVAAAGRICIFGVGASGIVARDIGTKLIRIGLTAHSYTDFHDSIMFATQLRDTDVLLAISYSGQTTDTLEIAHMARRCGARVITLTQYSKNPLRDLGDIPLFVSADESVIRPAAMTSRLTSLFMMDVLFTGVASRKFAESLELLNATREAAAMHRLVSGGDDHKGNGDNPS